MDTYAMLKDLDRRVQAGEATLLTVLDELRIMRAERFSRTQIEAAVKPDEPTFKELEQRVDQVEVDVAAALAGVEPVILNAQSEGEEAVDEPAVETHTPEKRKPGRPRRS